MNPNPLPDPLAPGTLPTALAPMQDVTDLPFMRLLGTYGVPDYFFTEYFRVHPHSTPEPHIIDSILHHGTGRPVFAQLIGEDIFHLRRTVKALTGLPVAGIDLNMGCPAPKVYKKNVGGGLLRDPDTVDRIFGALRDCIDGRFTVKMRIGFEDDRHFESLLDLVNKHAVDVLSLHGRTVKQMYRGDVDYPRIRDAVAHVTCPVLANGNITSPRIAHEVYQFTGCHGVMVGRSAIRNPWIFSRIRAIQPSQPHRRRAVPEISLGQVRAYIDDLWKMTGRPGVPERHHLNRVKKFVNFVGQGVDPEGSFLHEMRRARTGADFFHICDTHLLADGRDQAPFAEEPFAGVHARPNHEKAPACG